MAEFGIEGYGTFWLCLELVAQQGEEFSIKSGKNWKKALSAVTRIDIGKIENILSTMAELNLIDKKALKHNVLSIPKMEEYCDEYTKRVRRVSEQSTDNVRQPYHTIPNHTIINPTAVGTKKKTMKKNRLGAYKETDSSDTFEDVIDADTGEMAKLQPQGEVGKIMADLLEWSSKRRGGGFVNRGKQYKAMKMMRLAQIQPADAKARWIELENTDFAKKNGLDWMSVASSFDRKPK